MVNKEFMVLEDILRNDLNFREGLNTLLNTELEPILFDENDKFNTVIGLFESASNNLGLMKSLNRQNTDLISVLNTKKISTELKEVTQAVFPRRNIETGLKDAPVNAYYSIYIPLALYCRLLVPQLDKQEHLYFNATGIVTVGDFFDCINALFEGYSATEGRQTSLDNVSFDTDYFNKGYNRVVSSYASAIYNLYARVDFIRPITRVEVAYILVFGMNLLDTEYNTYINSDKGVGYTFNWLTECQDMLRGFEDCKDMTPCILNDIHKNPFDIRNYLFNETFSDYLEECKKGDRFVALPLLTGLLELCQNNVMYALNELNPLTDLSRGELVYIMFNLADMLSKQEKRGMQDV